MNRLDGLWKPLSAGLNAVVQLIVHMFIILWRVQQKWLDNDNDDNDNDDDEDDY